MTPTDFFRLVLKLFSLYSLITIVFSVIPSSYAVGAAFALDWTAVLWSAFAVLASIALFVALAFQSDRIVSKLKLAKGFDHDHIPFEKIDSKTIIKVGTIIIGGLLFIQNISYFLTHLYIAFRLSISGDQADSIFGVNLQRTSFDLVIAFVDMIVGYLLFTNYAWVSKWLAPKEEEV